MNEWDHPELRPRPYGSYDPDEPLVIFYADLIAACNAAAVLHVILDDDHTPLGEYHVQIAQHSLQTAVYPDGSSDDYLPDRAAAATWVRELRDRLQKYLLRPKPGPQN